MVEKKTFLIYTNGRQYSVEAERMERKEFDTVFLFFDGNDCIAVAHSPDLVVISQ